MTTRVCECNGYKIGSGEHFQPNCIEWFREIVDFEIAEFLGCVTNWSEYHLIEMGKAVAAHTVYFSDRECIICSDIISNELTNRGWGAEEFEVYRKLLDIAEAEEEERAIEEAKIREIETTKRLSGEGDKNCASTLAIDTEEDDDPPGLGAIFG